jgi:hypothetical protein
VGFEKLQRICLIENHDEALYIWRDEGVRQRILGRVSV